MITFWTLATLMLAVAIGILLWPLLVNSREPEAADADELNVAVFRDRLAELERDRIEAPLSPEEYCRARSELERELLQNTAQETTYRPAPRSGRRAAPVVGIIIPALAVGLYLHFGSPHLLADAGDSHPPTDGPAADPMGEVVAGLQARLRQQPGDVEGWLLLARTLVVMEHRDEATEALQQARKVVGEVPALLAEQAEIIAMGRDGEMRGEPTALTEQALQQDPAHPHALWLAGLAAAQQQQFPKAVNFWTRLLEVTPEDGDVRMIRANIERARAAMKQSADASQSKPPH